MKIQSGRADGFVAKPDKAVRAVLLYGPDAGLVRERMNALTKAVAGSADDPFRVAEFTADVLRDDPARLPDEAAAMSLTGGRRVVRIRDADSAPRLETTVADKFEAFFETNLGDTLVIVTAGDVGSKAKIVRVFEDADAGAAIACYADDSRALDTLVRGILKDAGLTASADAIDWLMDHLGGDRELTRRELEKLAMYMGGKGGKVEEADVIACLGDTAALSLDDLIFAVGDGDHATVQRVYGRLMAEGTSPISLINAVARHLLRLHETRGRMVDGKSAEAASMSLRPPPFYKYKAQFNAQATRWNEALLARGLELLNEAEMMAKSTDMPAEALTERALLQIANAAKSRARR